LAAIINRS